MWLISSWESRSSTAVCGSRDGKMAGKMVDVIDDLQSLSNNSHARLKMPRDVTTIILRMRSSDRSRQHKRRRNSSHILDRSGCCIKYWKGNIYQGNCTIKCVKTMLFALTCLIFLYVMKRISCPTCQDIDSRGASQLLVTHSISCNFSSVTNNQLIFLRTFQTPTIS